jgi:lipopolysaccharide/colanic/teichoic acid biosynthesis glycosyltransferase
MSRVLNQVATRALDLSLAIPAIIVMSPLFAILGILVSMDGGPIFYGHSRIDQAQRPFKCYKFRTMFVGANECLGEYLALHPAAKMAWQRDQKLDFDPRITGIGRLLRKTRIDALPQLVNVVRGEMSLVGPHPITGPERARYGRCANNYFSARARLTGLWRVSGQNQLTYAQRVQFGHQYVATQSIWSDLAVIAKTVRVLLKGAGR